MISASIGALLDHRHHQLAEEMLQFVTQTVPRFQSDEAAQALNSLDFEFPNVATALDTLDTQPEEQLYQLVMELYLAVGEYLDLRCLWTDNRRWGWALVEQAHSPELPADLLELFTQGDDTSLPETTNPAELKSLAERYNKLGLALWYKGQPDAAIHFLQKSLTLQQQIGSVLGITGLLLNISNVYYATEQYAVGLQHVLEALRIAQLVEHTQLEAHILPHLANSYLSNGMISEAGQTYERAIDLFEMLGDEPEIAEVKFNYALFCDLCGKHAEALQLAQASAAIMERHGFPGAATVRGWIAQHEQTHSPSD